MSASMDSHRPDALQYRRARFATSLPADYFYAPSHFWISQREEGPWRVGLTKFGSRLLGEMVDYGFEIEVGAQVSSGQLLGWVEGFKALSDVLCIAEGCFAGVNPALETNITLINQDPHGAGWLYAVRGRPDATCVNVQGYAKVLDETIDRLVRKAE
jgi:glycine cleavage system H protein